MAISVISKPTAGALASRPVYSNLSKYTVRLTKDDGSLHDLPLSALLTDILSAPAAVVPGTAGTVHSWYSFGTGLTKSGSNITGVADQSANAKNLTLVSGSSGPVSTANGAQFASSPQSNLELTTGFGSGGTPITAIVQRIKTAGALNYNSVRQAPMGWGSGGLGMGIGSMTANLTNELITISPTSGQFWGWCDGVATLSAGWHTIIFYVDSSTWKIRLDGVEMTVTNSGAFANLTQARMVIGSHGDNSQPFLGEIGEIINYTGTITPGAWPTIETALAAKWGN